MSDRREAGAGYLREDDPGRRSVVPPGVWVDDSDEDDPVLRNADGSLVDTWREDYPYAERLSREEYDHEKRLLQVELLKLQYRMQDSGRRFVVIFEGRDAVGKGSTIKRFMEHLNPRAARVVALDIPTERERGQWYFQRYISHLPTAGEITLFDRSWYNRAGVEKVMGFPVRQWKLSPTDIALLDKWEAYTAPKVAMFHRTHTPESPWTVVKSNDKKRARLEAMRSLLAAIDYDRKDHDAVGHPDPLIIGAPADMREIDPGDLSPTPIATNRARSGPDGG
jgi:polyphosphate kinase 2 (PPK2 family)